MEDKEPRYVNFIYEKLFTKNYSNSEIIKKEKGIKFKYYNYSITSKESYDAHFGIFCGIFSRLFQCKFSAKRIKKENVAIFYVRIKQ